MTDREGRLSSDDSETVGQARRGRRAVRASSRDVIDERDADERGLEQEYDATADRELSDDERIEMFGLVDEVDLVRVHHQQWRLVVPVEVV